MVVENRIMLFRKYTLSKLAAADTLEHSLRASSPRRHLDLGRAGCRVRLCRVGLLWLGVCLLRVSLLRVSLRGRSVALRRRLVVARRGRALVVTRRRRALVVTLLHDHRLHVHRLRAVAVVRGAVAAAATAIIVISR